MARVFTDGAETGDLLFWTTVNGTTVITTAAYVRSGTYCYASGGAPIKNLPTTLSEFYFRFGWRTNSTNCTPVSFNSTAGGVQASLAYASSKFSAKVGTTVVYTSADSFDAVNNIMLVEVHFKMADVGGVFQVKIDGNLVIDFSGDTKTSTYTTIDSFTFAGAAHTEWFDDFALNDTSGATDNSWCGDGRVVALTVNGAGDVTQLTPSTAVANYTCVDEIPVSATDYVESSTIGQYDLYNLTTVDLTGKTVRRVWVEGRSSDTVAVGGLCDLGIKTGGAEDWSSDISLLTSVGRIVGKDYPTKPGGGAWAQADIDALQAGFKVK
jgi:hypothetical protein